MSDSVYIVIIVTRQRDKRVGAVYYTRQQADNECDRLRSAQGGLEVIEAYWVKREVE